jgi:putative ABC transport system ATP-binding protein
MKSRPVQTAAAVAAPTQREPVIRIADLTKTYDTGATKVPALRGVSFQIQPGEMVAIVGQSGSGKSTLMNILGCLEVPTSGEYWLDGEYVAGLGDGALANIRNAKIGFVFQSYNLLPRLNALEQVKLPLIYRRARRRTDLAQAALVRVGLGDRMHHTPNRLSGGQQQRVAIARALVTEPEIILADEPTGNLDSSMSLEIMDVITRLNSEQGMTIILVTHEQEIAERCRRVITLHDGQIASDICPEFRE